MSALQIHATAALASKLGGFTAPPVAADGELILDRWYANLIRRRKPRVMLMNAETLMTVIVPLAPAATFAKRVPAYIAEQLEALDVSRDFIHAHVDRLAGAGSVVKTDDRRLVGILNNRLRHLDYWDAETEEDWLDLAAYYSSTITLAVDGPTHGLDRLYGAVDAWARTGVASVPAERHPYGPPWLKDKES